MGLLESAKKHTWYHTLELTPGVWTDGWFDLSPSVRHYGLSVDMSEMRALEVGTWDGFGLSRWRTAAPRSSPSTSTTSATSTGSRPEHHAVAMASIGRPRRLGDAPRRMAPLGDRGAPLVSVIVPALNAAATLGRTLHALDQQRLDGEYEVIVVDNGSSDGTFELASGWGPPVTVLGNRATEGVGAARNRGVKVAHANILAFTDADCFPTPDWLAAGLRAIEDADLIQGAVEPDPAAPRRPFDRSLVVRGESGWYQSANLFVRRELFEALGGFEDWIVESGGDSPLGWQAPSDGRTAKAARRPVGEDALFGWRARRAGARIAFDPDALVHHAVFPLTGWQFVRSTWWKRHMPGLAKRIPELRDEQFFGRWFYDRRTAGFDIAALALVTAAVTGRRAALAAAIPYARWIWEESAQWGSGRALPAAVGYVAADAASLGALVVGSIAWRALLL
jgi:hypothetical protein